MEFKYVQFVNEGQQEESPAKKDPLAMAAGLPVAVTAGQTEVSGREAAGKEEQLHEKLKRLHPRARRSGILWFVLGVQSVKLLITLTITVLLLVVPATTVAEHIAVARGGQIDVERLAGYISTFQVLFMLITAYQAVVTVGLWNYSAWARRVVMGAAALSILRSVRSEIWRWSMTGNLWAPDMAHSLVFLVLVLNAFLILSLYIAENEYKKGDIRY